MINSNNYSPKPFELGCVIFVCCLGAVALFGYFLILLWSCNGIDWCAKTMIFTLGAPDVVITQAPTITTKEIVIEGEKLQMENLHWFVSGANANSAFGNTKELFFTLRKTKSETGELVLSLDIRLNSNSADVVGITALKNGKYFSQIWQKDYVVCENNKWVASKQSLPPNSTMFLREARAISPISLTKYRQRSHTLQIVGSFNLTNVILKEQRDVYAPCDAVRDYRELSVEIHDFSFDLNSILKYRIEGMDGWHEF